MNKKIKFTNNISDDKILSESKWYKWIKKAL